MWQAELENGALAGACAVPGVIFSMHRLNKASGYTGIVHAFMEAGHVAFAIYIVVRVPYRMLKHNGTSCHAMDELQ